MGVDTGTATERLREHFEDQLGLYVETDGSDYVTLCQAHDDTRPSLAFRQDGARCVIFCRTGCDFQDIVRAMEIPRGFLKDDWEPEKDKPATAPAPAVDDFMPCGHHREKDYRYHDFDGHVVYVKSRCSQKATCRRGGFYLWHTDEDGEVQGGIGERERVLYRQLELVQAIKAGRTVYVVEGEKDADNGWAQNWPATTLFDGAKEDAKNWAPEYTALFAGAHVVVICDRDRVGISFGRGVARELKETAASVRLVQVHPAAGGKKADLTDHLDADLTQDDLVDLEPDQPALFVVDEQEPAGLEPEEPYDEDDDVPPPPDPGAGGAALQVPDEQQARPLTSQPAGPPDGAVEILDQVVAAGDDGGAALIAGAYRLGGLIATRPGWRNWAAAALVEAGLGAGLAREVAVHAARAGFTAGANRPMIKGAA